MEDPRKEMMEAILEKMKELSAEDLKIIWVIVRDMAARK